MIHSAGPLLKLGFISKPHGFEGKLKIVLTTNTTINEKEPVFLMFQGKPVPFFLDQLEPGDPLIASLVLIKTYEDARALTGLDVFVNEGKIDVLTETRLIGYTLIDEHLGEIGTVYDQIDQCMQKLILVRYQRRDCMIPIVNEILTHINHENKTITSSLPDGLLNLSEPSEPWNEGDLN